jgi:hypothetical protein
MVSFDSTFSWATFHVVKPARSRRHSPMRKEVFMAPIFASRGSKKFGKGLTTALSRESSS